MTWIEKLQTLTALQFENMLDQAIYDEEHVTVIFHTVSQEAVDGIEEHSFWFDYEGTNAQTGDMIGTRIVPNENGDYIVENVKIGTTHRVYPGLINTNTGADYEVSDNQSEFYIDKNNHEFYSLTRNEAQTTTTQ